MPKIKTSKSTKATLKQKLDTKVDGTTNSILVLSQELQGSVLKHLDAGSLARCACVCKRWRSAVRVSEGWDRCAVSDFGVRCAAIPAFRNAQSPQERYSKLMLDPGLAYCGLEDFFEKVWDTVSSWSLVISTERTVRNGNHASSSHPYKMYEWSSNAQRVDRFPQGFRLFFEVEDWTMFQSDAALLLDAQVRLQLIANMKWGSTVKEILVEDLCPFLFPMRMVRGMNSVDVWNDGGSMEYVGLRTGSQHKMVVFSMHFMRLLGSISGFMPDRLPRPRFLGKFMANLQNEPSKVFLESVSPREIPETVWVHMDMLNRAGKKVGVFDGMVCNVDETSADVAGTFSINDDVTNLVVADGGIYDESRRLINGFSGVPWKKVAGPTGRQCITFEVFLTFFRVFKVLRVSIEATADKGVASLHWELSDHHSRAGAHLCS
ncbi:hypothetical protein BSKO_09998 [Bryopsis sp. KO-2023]|nr:hypothetical protein BSKO_09998 [Bryopsis sp. KO-2023]